MKTSILLCPLLCFMFVLSPDVQSTIPAIISDAAEATVTDHQTAIASCPVPTGLYTTNITSTSAKFVWSAVYEAHSYSVQIRLPYGSWSYLPGSPYMNTSITVYGLEPGTTYEWRVRSNCDYGEYSNWSYPVSFTTDGSSSCGTPYNLHTLDITQTSAKWDWSSVSGATSYDVQWRYPGGPWNILVSDWPHSWVNVTGLHPGTTYEWRVRSECSYGVHSPWSEIESFTTLSGVVCHVPSDLYTSNITSTSAKLHWSPVSGANSYSIQIRHPYGDWTYVPGSPSYDTWVTVYNLVPATTYEWRVRANCGYGEHSNWSYPVSFTTDQSSSCNPPYNLHTLNITQTTAKWVWSDVSGATSYDIQWRYPGGTWYTLVSDWPHSWVNVTGLHPATTYEWRVRSKCGYGSHSPWSQSVSFTTLGATCDKPTGLHTTNITSNSAKLHWSQVYGAHSYSVQIQSDYGIWEYVPGSPFYDTWVTVYNLHPHTTYKWRVRANCDYGVHSDWSHYVTFTTPGSSTCDAPHGLHTENITHKSATWKWSPVYGATSYTIQWRYPGGPWNTLVTGWPHTWVNVGGLQPGTTYEWRVKSNCSYGSHSEWSDVASFTTPENPCHKPTGLHTTDITDSSAKLHWSPVPGAESYSVQIRLPYGNWYYVSGSPFYDTWATVYGLSPGKTYHWRVRANCGYGEKSYWSHPASFTTSGAEECHAPEYLNTINITSTTATWDWSPVPGAYSYSVQWRYPGGNWNNLYGGPWTHTALNIWGLEPGTTYEWRVRSNCSYGTYSEWSASAVFTTTGAACHKPTGLSTTDITDTSATFSWSPVDGAMSYSVQIRLPNGQWQFVTGSPFTDTSVTVTNLSPGTYYCWRVRSNCQYAYSHWASPLEFTTTGTSPCAAPDSTYTSHITDTRARLNWTEVEGAISYAVEWRQPGGYWHIIPTGPWPYLYLQLAGLQPSSTYEWRVRALCSGGLISPWTDVETFTTLDPGLASDIDAFGSESDALVFDMALERTLAMEELVAEDISESNAENAFHESVIVWPNPAFDILNISYQQTEKNLISGLMLTDMSGKVVFSKAYQEGNLAEFNEEIDVSGLTSGMYSLQVVTTNGVISERVMIVR